MIKKLFLTILLAVMLFNFGIVSMPVVHAQSTATNDSEFMFDLGVIQQKDMESAEKQNWIKKGVNFLFERAIAIMAATVGGAAVLMMTIGGFMMLASAGRQEMYDKGKGMVWKAVIGLIFVLGAYILVTTVQLLIQSIFN